MWWRKLTNDYELQISEINDFMEYSRFENPINFLSSWTNLLRFMDSEDQTATGSYSTTWIEFTIFISCLLGLPINPSL